MKKIMLLAIVAGGIFTMEGPASAQGIYLDLGGDGGERGYYRPNNARFRTFNGCQNGWTVQDGLCKPYRGY